MSRTTVRRARGGGRASHHGRVSQSGADTFCEGPATFVEPIISTGAAISGAEGVENGAPRSSTQHPH